MLPKKRNPIYPKWGHEYAATRASAFTETEGMNAVAELLEAAGVAVDYYSIFNKVKLPTEPEWHPQGPLSEAEKKRLQRLRKKGILPHPRQLWKKVEP